VAARRERGEVEVEGGIWVVGLGRGVGFAVCGLSGIWKASGKWQVASFCIKKLTQLELRYSEHNRVRTRKNLNVKS
jgi:hypothetical protein